MSDVDNKWIEFEQAVLTRLSKGREEYGDRSFAADPDALVRELEAEALDLAGWGFVLWCRLRRVREAAERLRGF